MSFQAQTAACEVRGIAPLQKFMLMTLANYAGPDGKCWPSQKTLADDTGLGERTVRRLLAELEAAQLISRKPERRADGSRRADLITLNLHNRPERPVAADQPATQAGGAAREAGGGATQAGLTSFEPVTEPVTEPEDRFALVVAAQPQATPEPIEQALADWNEMAGRAGLPIARSLTPDRRRHLKARLKAHGLDGWRDALARVEASPHCCGANNRGWRADLDFLFQSKSWNRLLEGSYDQRAPTPGLNDNTPRRGMQGYSALDQAVEGIGWGFGDEAAA